MIWKEGPQPRIYRLIVKGKATPASGGELAGRMEKPEGRDSTTRIRLYFNGEFDN